MLVLDVNRALLVARAVGDRRLVVLYLLLDTLLLLCTNLVALEHCTHDVVSNGRQMGEERYARKASSSSERLDVSGKRNQMKATSKRRKTQ